MKPLSLVLFCLLFFTLSGTTQTNNKTARKQLSKTDAAAVAFVKTLTDKQKQMAMFVYNDSERYNWYYVPIARKGIPLKNLEKTQENAAMALLQTVLSESGYQKTKAIIQLENVLKESEGRPADDHYRDPTNYYFSIFGDPTYDAIWGWRLEGHHVSLNFSSENNKLISASPGFMGSNPAIVLSGPEKGKEILKDETDLGLSFLHSLNEEQLKTAIISTRAPGDIVTSNKRKAMIDNPQGILYSALTKEQQKLFLELLSIYIHRYTVQFANDMMKDIEKAGLNKLQFAWAGQQETGPGHPTYYRIQGPTLLIEYDNTQNNANHIHSVVRDLAHDFGGDELLEHYKNGHL